MVDTGQRPATYSKSQTNQQIKKKSKKRHGVLPTSVMASQEDGPNKGETERYREETHCDKSGASQPDGNPGGIALHWDVYCNPDHQQKQNPSGPKEPLE